ncbi:unnamed protein product [Trichobilharzia szidati]|nr:unnamed protein product [Trichobilharzia szidati]
MITTTSTKYILVTLTILDLFNTVVASSSEVRTQKDLISDLYKNGFIKSWTVKQVMTLVDRQFFVRQNPYEDSSQPVEYGARIAAPRTHARILDGLIGHLKRGVKVSCVLCDSGYLIACMAVLVTAKGIVIGVQTNLALTIINYENIEKWVANTDRVKSFGFKKHVPFLLFTRDHTSKYVPGEGLDAIYYHGDDPRTLKVLQDRLRPGGRLIYEKSTGSDDPELMVVDKLSNGSLYERSLTDVMMESAKEEEVKEGEREESGGVEDLLPPRPVLPG